MTEVGNILSRGINYVQLPSPQLSVDLCSIGLTYLLKDRGDKIAPTNLK